MDLGLKPAIQLVMNRIPLNDINGPSLENEYPCIQLIIIDHSNSKEGVYWSFGKPFDDDSLASHKMTQMDLGLNPVYSCRSPQSSPSDPQAGCSRTKW